MTPYVSYSGYVDVLNEVMNKLYSADTELYAAARLRMPEEIKAEYASYSAFFDKYRESTASKVSGTINNAYISSHGQRRASKARTGRGLWWPICWTVRMRKNFC